MGKELNYVVRCKGNWQRPEKRVSNTETFKEAMDVANAALKSGFSFVEITNKETGEKITCL